MRENKHLMKNTKFTAFYLICSLCLKVRITSVHKLCVCPCEIGNKNVRKKKMAFGLRANPFLLSPKSLSLNLSVFTTFRFPHLQFDYRDPEKNFDRRKVSGLVCKLIKVRDVKNATALEVAAGGKVIILDHFCLAPDFSGV